MIKDSRAYKYAEWAADPDNHFVGNYVKKQAKLWTDIADNKNEEAYVDEKQFRRITKLLKLMIHPDIHVTMYEGLEDYAVFFIYALFCTRDRTDNTRYYTTGILEIARKNFKTFTSAVIFIIGLLTEAKFSRFFSVAPDLSLSSELQIAIKKIIKSSPCLAHEYIFDDLKKKRQKAILYENKRENFLCKHLNILYKGLGVEGYVEITRVKQCVILNDPDFWRGKRVYLGLDLSQSDDNTSVAMVTFHEGEIYAAVWGFIPADRKAEKSQREKVNYQQLIDNGVCFECGDDVIDYSFIERFIQSLSGEYGVEIVQLGFDRYNAISTVQKLESGDDPIECVEIKQHSSVLHRPTKLLKEYILSRKFSYFENRMLEINFQNARCTEDTNLNKYVNKKKSAGKVDMVVSLINAIYLLQVNELDNAGSDFGCQKIWE